MFWCSVILWQPNRGFCYSYFSQNRGLASRHAEARSIPMMLRWAGKARATFRLSKDNPWIVGKAFCPGMFAISTKRWGTSEDHALYWSKQESGKYFLPLRDYTTAIKLQIRHSNMSESNMFPSTAFCQIKAQTIRWYSMCKGAEKIIFKSHGLASETYAKRVISNRVKIQTSLQKFPECSYYKMG